MKALIWLLLDTSSVFADIINYTLLSFLLWENGQSIELILQFNLCVFIGIILSSLVSGTAQFVLGRKLMFMLGMGLHGVIAVFAYLNSSDLSSQLPAISLMYGAAYALIQNAKGLMTLSMIPQDKSVGYSSRKEIIMSVGSLATPFLTKILIDNLGYQQSFLFLAVIFIAIAVMPVALRSNKLNQQRQVFIMPGLLTKSLTTSSIRSLALIHIALGISGVFGWGLLNIIILDVLGSLQGWTNISTGLAFAGIVIALLLNRVKTEDRYQSKSIIVLGSLLYAAVPVMLLANFSVELFVAFTFVKLLYDKTNFIVTYNYLNQIERRDPEFEKHKLSFQMFNSFFMGIGRIIPVAALLLLPAANLSINVLILGFSFVALAPLVFSQAYNHEFQGGYLD